MMETDTFSLRKYTAVVAVLIVLIMTVLDGTVVNVALPVLAGEFQVADSEAVWIVTIYQLLITLLLLPLSSVGDLFSYRRTFLAGVVVFTLSSVFCAASESFTTILVARAIQGVGAACVMSVNIALTRLIYPAKVLGRGLALNAMVIACATAAGPTIAGVLLSIASWHWLFLVNVPFGVVAFALGYKLLPDNPPAKTKPRFDVVSALANILLFGLLFFALGMYTGKDDLSTMSVLLGAALVVGIFYIRRERTIPSPMLPVDLFRIKLYSLSITTSVCSFIAQMLAMVSLPFILLGSYGFSSITTGLLMTPWPLATMIVSPLAARFVERHSAGATAAAGMGVYALGILSMLLLPSEGISAWDIAWRMTICGIGYGMFQTPNSIIMVTATPVQRTGSAGGMQSTARLVGQTFGAALVTIVFSAVGGTPYHLVHVCLWLAIAFALIAGGFSISRRVKG